MPYTVKIKIILILRKRKCTSIGIIPNGGPDLGAISGGFGRK
jgi:hypothetical protein